MYYIIIYRAESQENQLGPSPKIIVRNNTIRSISSRREVQYYLSLEYHNTGTTSMLLYVGSLFFLLSKCSLIETIYYPQFCIDSRQ